MNLKPWILVLGEGKNISWTNLVYFLNYCSFINLKKCVLCPSLAPFRWTIGLMAHGIQGRRLWHLVLITVIGQLIPKILNMHLRKWWVMFFRLFVFVCSLASPVRSFIFVPGEKWGDVRVGKISALWFSYSVYYASILYSTYAFVTVLHLKYKCSIALCSNW